MSFRKSLGRLALAAAFAASPLAAAAQGLAGPYLAARAASGGNDFAAAATYYTQAIVADPGNPILMENAVRAFVGLGQIDRATAVARRMQSLGAVSQIAAMVLIADQIKRASYDSLLDDLSAGMSVGPMVDGLMAAWAEFGRGRMSDALIGFDAVAESPGIEVFGLYHKALALAAVGDLEGAHEILSGRAAGQLALDRRGVIAHAQILSQLERNDDALALIEEAFAGRLDAELSVLVEALEAGRAVPFTALPDAAAGAAEVYFVVAGALNGEANDSYTLMYSRLAEFLRPDHVGAILLSAALLERVGSFDLATDTYNRISPDNPAFDAAEIGRAEALRRSGRTEAAIEVLQGLARSRPGNASVHITLGDTLRGMERYADAAKAYSEAIALFGAPSGGQWVVYFGRGIAYERTDEWDKAEADFRRALELRPDQPQVMNYLGYSFVEMGVNLDEALDLIERAVAAEPESGYIVDSLGWVQFRTGEYSDAVLNLERATELLPIDPIVNDHLGDAYWAVGRDTEARFQWKRALSFDPEPEEAERIRRKLEVGLDAVLEEEGAEPLQVTVSDG